MEERNDETQNNKNELPVKLANVFSTSLVICTIAVIIALTAKLIFWLF